MRLRIPSQEGVRGAARSQPDAKSGRASKRPPLDVPPRLTPRAHRALPAVLLQGFLCALPLPTFLLSCHSSFWNIPLSLKAISSNAPSARPPGPRCLALFCLQGLGPELGLLRGVLCSGESLCHTPVPSGHAPGKPFPPGSSRGSQQPCGRTFKYIIFTPTPGRAGRRGRSSRGLGGMLGGALLSCLEPLKRPRGTRCCHREPSPITGLPWEGPVPLTCLGLKAPAACTGMNSVPLQKFLCTWSLRT